MKRFPKPFLWAATLAASGCGLSQHNAEQKTQPTYGLPIAMTVNDRGQLPLCDLNNEHRLIYVAATRAFTACSHGVWVDINLNGQDGKTPLIRVVDIPAGTNCEAGGKAILIGYDHNGDGLLQDAEVATTNYVCNGLKGEKGDKGDKGDRGDAGRDASAPATHA